MDETTITDEVLGQFQLSDPRQRQLIHGLVRHLHDYAREVVLTHDEWRAGLRFLTAMADITDEHRNEFSLLSDILGLSSLVDLMQSVPGATPGSVLGPFHVHDSHYRENGVDLAGGQEGEPTLYTGCVRSLDGAPLAAELDFWQNADNGLYPQVDPAQDPHNLRCKLRTGADGVFRLRTIRPRPYAVPEDGPVGDLLRLAGRHCMRAAHFHVIVSAPGHRSLVTEVFLEGDPYLETDAVFGVRPALILTPEVCADPVQAREAGMPVPFLRIAHDIRLVPAPEAAGEGRS